MTSDIRVLIAEDQTLMRQGLRTILELNEGFTVIGEAENGREAVERALALQPDVVLMDVQMPEMNGVAATAQITQALPATRVILLTTFDYDEYVFDGMKAGARGYLLKDMAMADLLSTIRRIHAGESIVQPSVATRLISELSQRRATPQQPEYEPLSARELEVLRLLADGWTNKAIAAQLVLTEGTIKNYVSTILDKLHAANRTHATQIARKQGLIE
jgi:two-component system, NarL family, response regulator DegU